MSKLIIKDVLDKINGKLVFGNVDDSLDSFETDSRKIVDNVVFVGIKGENVDGSKFYLDALNSGAKGCIINRGFSNEEEISGKFLIEVDDTVKALQELAKIKRSMYDIPVVAVTGSVGKTSTKDIIASVLGTKYNVLKTEGNHNNEIGMPLTILSLKDHNAMVLEMGMSSFGEISLLSKIAKPTIGVITNIGTAHIGILGSRENILKAKLEIMDGLDGKLIINNDNDMLHSWNLNNKLNNVITVGINNKSDFMASNIISKDDKTTFTCNNDIYDINANGEAFVYNSLTAVAISKLLDIDYNKTKYGLVNFKLTSGRNEIIKCNGYIVVNDCYNASVDSIKEALKNLSNSDNKRKIAVLGDILELGDFSKEIHKKVGEEVLKNNIDILVTVGNESKIVYDVCKNSMESYHFDNNKDAINYLKSTIKDDDKILVKASNGMKFIEIVDSLR